MSTRHPAFGRLTTEAIELIRALWKGEPVTHRGAYYQTRKAKLYTRSDEPLPLYVSAMVPNSARFAGIYGDGLITVGGESPETYHQILENFAAGAKTAGKDPNRLPRIIELGVDFTDDKEKAIAIRKAFWAGTFVPALFTEKIYTPKMSETNGKAVGSDTISESSSAATKLSLRLPVGDMGGKFAGDIKPGRRKLRAHLAPASDQSNFFKQKIFLTNKFV